MQGVGFRPYVYVLAKANAIKGCVSNTNDGVHIKFNATDADGKLFYKKIIANAPQQATIIRHTITEIDREEFVDFKIANSIHNNPPNLLLTPDFALCNECKQELNNPKNRRYNYPFITCTQCGPRYSIVKCLPYDRENTTMANFEMCTSCKEEYNNPLDKRYFSQTNSCKDCAIQMTMYNNNTNSVLKDNDAILQEINTQLVSGKIVSVKGIGGYLLLCDATNKNAIKELRKRKQRYTKPFAVMFANENQLQNYANPSKEELECISSSISPIVILNAKQDRSISLNDISPNLNTIGAMLPNAALLYLIARQIQKPLVTTSANISNSPIIYKDHDALQYLKHIADFIVTNNREILTPQDDSVVQFTKQSKRQIILRRARGMAPSYLSNSNTINHNCIATGALMKSSFAIQANDKLYFSQFLGNTDTLEAQQYYSSTLTHLSAVLNLKPLQIISDKHPHYFSTELANALAEKYKINVTQVQHHKAHFAAVLAENYLLNYTEPILGVILDGTGFGDNGKIWGSEFFIYENNTMQRVYCFDYFPQLLVDKMVREPRLSALSICNNVTGSDVLLQSKFTETEWNLYKKILQSENQIECSSMGRIFDAVASLLNVCDKQSYEGEAAMYVQKLAENYFESNDYAMLESYFSTGAHLRRIPTETLFTGIVNDILKKKNFDFIAAKFHFSLVHIVEIAAANLQIKKIAFSGGVFQNTLLVDMLEKQMNKKELYFNSKLSANDENISFGQLVYVNSKIK